MKTKLNKTKTSTYQQKRINALKKLGYVLPKSDSTIMFRGTDWKFVDDRNAIIGIDKKDLLKIVKANKTLHKSPNEIANYLHKKGYHNIPSETIVWLSNNA